MSPVLDPASVRSPGPRVRFPLLRPLARALAGLLVVAAALPPVAGAQLIARRAGYVVRFAAGPVSLEGAPAVLRQSVSLDLANVSVEDALRALTERTGVSLTYSRAVVPLDRRPIEPAADRDVAPVGHRGEDRGRAPEQTGLVLALGLARHGYREEANRIAMAMIDAASFTGYRLPEAFSGYGRSVSRFPVPYPTACSPQAWATGAPMVFVRTMLGLEARDGALTLDPVVPQELGRISIRGIPAFGSLWDVEALGRSGTVKPGGRRT